MASPPPKIAQLILKVADDLEADAIVVGRPNVRHQERRGGSMQQVGRFHDLDLAVELAIASVAADAGAGRAGVRSPATGAS